MKATALVLVSLPLTSSAQDTWKGALHRAKALRQTDPSGASREFQTAERLASHVGGESLVRVWIDLAGFLIQQRSHHDAETVLRNALNVQDQTPGISAASRARVLNSLALTQLDLGRYEETIDLLRSAIGVFEGASTADRESMLPNLNLLTALYLQTGRTEDARLLVRKILRSAKDIGTNRDLAQAWISLSEIERIAGNHIEARRAARNALKLVGAMPPYDSPLVEGAHNQLAKIAYEMSDNRTAAIHWKLTLDSLRARLPETDGAVLNLRADIAHLAVREGRLQEAEKELLAVTKLAIDQGGGIVLANGLYVLGTVYAQQKRFHEAIAVFVRSLDISDKQISEMSPNSALCLGDLATIYLRIHQPAEAEKFSNRAAHLSAGDGTVALVWLDVMQIHAQVLQKLNRKAEAKEVQKQVSSLVASRRMRNQTVDVADLMRR